MNAGRFERDRLKIESQSRGRSNKWRKRAMKHLVEESGAEVIAIGKRVYAYKMEDGSTACHKRRFKTQDAANETLRQIAVEPEPRKKPIRAYFCKYCEGWHVTSEQK